MLQGRYHFQKLIQYHIQQTPGKISKESKKNEVTSQPINYRSTMNCLMLEVGVPEFWTKSKTNKFLNDAFPSV